MAIKDTEARLVEKIASQGKATREKIAASGNWTADFVGPEKIASQGKATDDKIASRVKTIDEKLAAAGNWTAVKMVAGLIVSLPVTLGLITLVTEAADRSPSM